ncbi:hypothetical protein [Dactylosporangium sp. NPDC048998]|uniref:hypothetical protein n=1 Tax=Dactylosporangium sp. NPDC048998 TaxID=3363976 RepID=UPI00371AD778
MLRRLLPRPDRGEGAFRFGLRLLVVALCAAALLQAMRPAAFSTRAGVETVRNTSPNDGSRLFREQLEYVSAEMERQVPAGTRVVVVDDNPEWDMRLVEFATLHGIVVVSGQGDLEVRRKFDRAAPHGVRLVIRKPVAG